MNQKVDDQFSQRLENWGIYYRMTGSPAGTSATWEVCRRLAKDAGEIGQASSAPKREIDEADARVIEWCWSQSGYRMDRKHHAMLKAHFINRMDPRVICRHLQMRYLSYDSELAKAVKRFSECVKMMETFGSNTATCKPVETGYNLSHQPLTTAY
jgi:hypothetical protein